MAWNMTGQMLESCSCKMLCPCALGPAEPDQGWCAGALVFDIQRGQADGVSLDRTTVVLVVNMPGDFLGGNGTARLYVDEAASAAQRQELELTFRRASLTFHVASITPDAYCNRWTCSVVATPMLQRRTRLKDVLGRYLNRQPGMALLERVAASDLSDADRARVSRIIRTMRRLPGEPGQAPSLPEASAPSAHASRRRQRRSS
jgi:hypothetical protein